MPNHRTPRRTNNRRIIAIPRIIPQPTRRIIIQRPSTPPHPVPHAPHHTQRIPRRKILLLLRRAPSIRHVQMSQMPHRRRTPQTRILFAASPHQGRCWGSRPRRLQELPDVLAEFLARGYPVGADVVAQGGECVFEVELVLLEPGDVEVLAGGAALELAGDVFVVVADDPLHFVNISFSYV